MKKLLTIFEAFILIALVAVNGFGATKTSTATGLWSAGATWVGGVAPASGDDAVIANGHVVTLNADASITNCTVNTGGSLVAGSPASTVSLTVSGTLTLQSGATFTQGGTVTAVPGASRSFNNASTYVFNGTQNGITGFFTFGNLTWSSTLVGGATPGGDLTVNGNLTLLNCYDLGASFQAVSGNQTVMGDVVIDGANAALVGKSTSGVGTGTWNILGNVTTQNGGTLRGCNPGASANAAFNIGGNFIDNGAFDIGNGSSIVTIAFNGSSAQGISGNAFDANNITVNNSAGVSLSTDVGITGVLTLTSGAFANSTHLTMYPGSSISRSAGTLSAAPTTTAVNVAYTGAGPITTGNELQGVGGLGDLTINCSGGVILNADANVNGNLIFTSGKITLGANSLTLGGGGSVISGASSSNYVVTSGNGFLSQNVAGSVLFPIGTSSSSYNPATLDNTGGTADMYSVRVKASTANVVTVAGVVGDQWTMTEANPTGSNIIMTLQWNAGEEGASFASSRASGQIGKYSGAGTSWSLMGTTIAGSGPYTAQNTAAITNTFSSSVVSVGLSAALPVELTSFTAASRNGSVELSWSTASEMNNYGFEVERKQIPVNPPLQGGNGEAAGGFKKIAFVDGHGSTNVPHSYVYTDASARVGKFSYRLKQIDRNGNVEYLQAVEATLGVTPNTVWLENNYPNPFNPSTKISFALGTTGYASLKVFNIVGQEVVTLASGVFNANELQTYSFDASQYSSGIYYYQLKSGGKTEMKKMLLLK